MKDELLKQMKDELLKQGNRANAAYSVFWAIKAIFFTFIFTAFAIPLLAVYLKVPLALAVIIYLALAISISVLIVKRRIRAVKKSMNIKEKGAKNNAVETMLDEKILGAIFAITKTVGKSFSVLGSGENLHPENSIVFTNKRILMLQVPVAGGSSVMENTPFGRVDAVQANMLINKSGIRKKGKELLSAGLNTFINSAPIKKEIAAAEVESVKIGWFTIKIKTSTGKSYKYTLGDFKSKSEAKQATEKLPY